MKQIAVTAPQEVNLIETPDPDARQPAGHVVGQTLATLVSPGTEINWAYLGKNDKYPVFPGYACVFQVTDVGEGVEAIAPGQLVLAEGPHAEMQIKQTTDVVPLPEGLAPEIAVYARLMVVSMSTLNTAAAHPPARVLVTGLGPVGNLAAQMFQLCGYDVTAVDPLEARRGIGTACGLRDVRPATDKRMHQQYALHLECSGHEQAVIDGASCLRKKGELVLVGAWWKQYTQVPAFDLLKLIFKNYLIVRSGWEWEIPKQEQDFCFHSQHANFAKAMEWLKAGSIDTSHLGKTFAPREAPAVYAGLADRSLPVPAPVFDWSRL